MAQDRRIYGDVQNQTDLHKIFGSIRKDVEGAKSREGLTELYRRAGYLIALTHAPSWREKFGRRATRLRDVGEEEFARTARAINRRAKAIGDGPDYDERWGD
jgi:hypothetical protein